MRSFRLPTRIDGCNNVRENITTLFNTTIYSSILNETTTTTSLIQTVVKFVEEFQLKLYFVFDIFRKNPLVRFYGMSYFWYTMFSIFTALIVSVVVSYFTGRK
jgi:hypothetical protein